MDRIYYKNGTKCFGTVLGLPKIKSRASSVHIYVTTPHQIQYSTVHSSFLAIRLVRYSRSIRQHAAATHV